MRIGTLALGTILALGLAAPAEAAIVSGSFAFEASGSPNGFPGFNGAFTITFDNRSSVVNSTIGITLTGLSIPLGSAVGFTYSVVTDSLRVGGIENGTNTTAPGTADFTVLIESISTVPVFSTARYSTVANTAENSGDMLTGSVTRVPEPASLGLLVLGAAALAGIRRRAA